MREKDLTLAVARAVREELLRQGRVVCALSSDTVPVPGHRAQTLGTLRYLPLATPEYVERHLPEGPTAEALAYGILQLQKKIRRATNFGETKTGLRDA